MVTTAPSSINLDLSPSTGCFAAFMRVRARHQWSCAMSKDLSTVLDTALSHASTHADDALSNALSTAMSHNSNSNASVPGFADLLPQTQGVPPSSPGSDPTP